MNFSPYAEYAYLGSYTIVTEPYPVGIIAVLPWWSTRDSCGSCDLPSVTYTWPLRIKLLSLPLTLTQVQSPWFFCYFTLTMHIRSSLRGKLNWIKEKQNKILSSNAVSWRQFIPLRCFSLKIMKLKSCQTITQVKSKCKAKIRLQKGKPSVAVCPQSQPVWAKSTHLGFVNTRALRHSHNQDTLHLSHT